jgi:drug/metabolite transporter (DMT)-like permease
MKPFQLPSHAVQGALWMLLAACATGGIPLVVRHLSSELPSIQIGFMRFLAGSILMLPWALKVGAGAFGTARPWFHVLRAGSGAAAMACSFTAFGLMPLANATALTFTTPLFTTMGAALFLGETVRVRRWTAVAIGFIGALIILRPGVAQVSWPEVLMLLSAFFAAGSALCMKSLSRTESPATTVLYMSLFITILSGIPAAFVWVTPSWTAIGWGLVLGVFGTIANLAMIRSFMLADASAVMPVDFTRLIFVALFAFVLYAERPDFWVWIGAGIIFGSTLYTTHREAQLARLQRRTAMPLPPDRSL